MYRGDVQRIQEALMRDAKIVLEARFPEGVYPLTISEVDTNRVLGYYGSIPFTFELEPWMIEEMASQI